MLLLFTIAWLILVWAAMADNPLLPFVDSVRIQLHDSQWLIWLAGLELLRQVHYLVAERSARYYRFWSQKVFGAADRAMRKRMSDWTRFRLARMIKVVLLVALFAAMPRRCWTHRRCWRSSRRRRCSTGRCR